MKKLVIAVFVVASLLSLAAMAGATVTTLFSEDFQGIAPENWGSTAGVANGWVHDQWSADGWGYIGLGRDGTAVFATLGRWGKPLLSKPIANTMLTVSVFQDPTAWPTSVAPTSRVALTKESVTAWGNDPDWPAYGPGIFFNSNQLKLWLRAPMAAGGLESAHVDVPLASGVYATQTIMVINTITGSADAYYGSVAPENLLISGFDMKGSLTDAAFAAEITSYPHLFVWAEGESAQFDNFSITCASMASISGNVVISDYSGASSDALAIVTLAQNSAAVATYKVPMDDAGNFTVQNVAPGMYDITVKTYANLSQTLPAVQVVGDTNVGTFSLPGGDIDGDNEVTSTDLSILGLNLGMMGS